MAGLYVHIPFCFSRCGYCDFFKSTNLKAIPAFVDSLSKEIASNSHNFPFEVNTIYFGGGTPSLLSAKLLKVVLDLFYKHYNVSNDSEITIECNPDDLNPSYLDEIINIGFNRLSIGIQSFNDVDLVKMGRRHNANQGFRVIQGAVKAGFNNIGVDFIYGLPWSNRDSFLQNLDFFKNLPVQHISAYHLSIEKGTAFHKKKLMGQMKEINDSESLEQYLLLCNGLHQVGMDHYEVSNFSKPGCFSRHNSSYWKGVPYLGFGPGSHSYVNNKRFWNKAFLNHYLSGQFNLLYQEETLSNVDRYNEMIMLGLRACWGVDMERCRLEFADLYKFFLTLADKWCKRGLLYIEESHLKCREESWFQVDGIIEDFIVSNT